ncbi:MAG: hypothetical protein IKN49_00620 [Elusimicrobiaceae bacterium]|nr:hypothetical protein [Elusimicrobiaceae bacterium]
MNKLGVIGISLLLLGACAEANHQKTRQKMSGIDYSAYTRPTVHSTDDYTSHLPQPSILDEQAFSTTSPTEQEEYTPSADEDFTSEEIASSYGRYTDVTVVAAVKRIKLGAQANAKNMALFQQALTTGYKKALRTYRPGGFTYSMSSVGAVNPLSDVEVNCVLGEQAANEIGQQTCNLFFKTVVEQYNTLLQEAQANAAL